jgi:hypothetical protein
MFIGSGFGLNRVSAAGDAYGILNGLFRPALVMDFGDEYYRANGASQTFSDAMTHTRASTATMVDSDGALKWGPHNLVARSEEFDNAFWVKSVGAVGGVTANATTAPSGTLTADKIENVSGGTVDTKVTGPISVAAKFITFQCYAKAGASNYLMMFIGGGVLGLTAGWFNLATGTVGTTQVNVQSATMTDAGNGWYLCKIVTVDVSGLGSATGLNVEVASADGVSTADAGDSIFVWGASAYRSDLGGMVDNPDQSAGFETYVPTTSAARYLPRRGHHVWNGTAWVNEGLLHESEARTNLLTYSEDLSNAAWLKNAGMTIGTPVTRKGISLDLIENNGAANFGPTPSSYIPTNSGSTVTRAADVLTIPAANLPWPEPVVIGPELVTNGDFSDGTNDWLAIHGVISVVDGALRVEEDGVNASSPRGYQGLLQKLAKCIG